MRILGDGLGSPSVSYEGRLSDVSRKNWQFIAAEDVHVRPAEFTISPTSDFVSPQSHVTVEVKWLWYTELDIHNMIPNAWNWNWFSTQVKQRYP